MKKLIVALTVSIPLGLLTGCAVSTVGVDTVVYDPGYSNNYVYSVGYYNQPYWGYSYYPASYYSINNAYWGTGYYNGY